MCTGNGGIFFKEKKKWRQAFDGDNVEIQAQDSWEIVESELA